VIFDIQLEGLEVFAYHGVMQHEKDYGQNFLIDCRLSVDAGSEDHIDHTVSYALVADTISELATKNRFDLIETLASRLVATVLDLDPRILRCTITVHKPHAPLSQSFKDVSVRFSGARGED
jgi:dihydroneopterin aldolase